MVCGSVGTTSGFDLFLKYAQNVIRESQGDVFTNIVFQSELA